MKKQPKQNADKSSGNPQRDNFDAEELGEQSTYDEETEIAQRMRRGSAGKGKKATSAMSSARPIFGTPAKDAGDTKIVTEEKQ